MPWAPIFQIIAKNRDSAKMLAAGDADSAFRCLGQVECCLCVLVRQCLHSHELPVLKIHRP